MQLLLPFALELLLSVKFLVTHVLVPNLVHSTLDLFALDLALDVLSELWHFKIIYKFKFLNKKLTFQFLIQKSI